MEAVPDKPGGFIPSCFDFSPLNPLYLGLERSIGEPVEHLRLDADGHC